MSYRRKYVFQKQQMTNVKALNMITNKNEPKTMTKHISRDCKYKFNSTTCNSNQEWKNKTYQCEYKNYQKCKEDYSSNLSICICENSKYLKSIAHTSKIECDEIICYEYCINNKDKYYSNKCKKNCHSKKVRDCYILHAILLAITLLLTITIICYYAKQKGTI